MRRPSTWLGWVGAIALGALGLLLVAQIVPYGRSHANPPVTRAAQFPTAESKQLFARACGDCHSNETTWPWYSNVAPVSWLVQRDVDEGRQNFNVSEWNRPQPDVGEVTGIIREGEMPPLQYKIIHSGARLSGREKQALIDGLTKLYQQDPPG